MATDNDKHQPPSAESGLDSRVWDDLYLLPSRPRIFRLQWHITERCNMRCKHCYQGESRRNEVTPRQIDVVLAQFKELYHARLRVDKRLTHGLAMISLIGGEPLLHPLIRPLCERLAQDDEIGIGIITNASRIDGPTARWLKGLGPSLRYVQVSLDGGEAVNDPIRGAGAFRRTRRGVEHLRSAGISVIIKLTAQRANFRQFPEVARIGREWGVQTVRCDRLLPIGGAAEMRQSVLDRDETREFLSLVAEAKAAAGDSEPSIYARCALLFLASGGQPYSCDAGDTYMALLANGDLLPCRRMPRVVGNVFRTPMKELYESAFLRSLRETDVCRDCRGCPHAQSCRGGSRCMANAIYGDPLRGDPGCWLAAESARR